MDVIRTMIVDDHEVVRQGLERLIGGFEGVEVVAVASGGEEAVALAALRTPDVVMMDLEMPGAYDGVEATRRIVAANPHTNVVVLTSFSDRARILRAFDAGAIGYLLKDGSARELERAIRAAAIGDFPVDPRAARILFERGRDPLGRSGLSDREREVIALVGAGMSNRDIAARLGITERTVKGHLTTIFRAIGVDNRTQAALWAQQAGIVPAPSPPTPGVYFPAR